MGSSTVVSLRQDKQVGLSVPAHRMQAEHVRQMNSKHLSATPTQRDSTVCHPSKVATAAQQHSLHGLRTESGSRKEHLHLPFELLQRLWSGALIGTRTTIHMYNMYMYMRIQLHTLGNGAKSSNLMRVYS